MSTTNRLFGLSRWALVGVMAIGAAACGDDGNPVDPTPPPDSGLQPTFSSIQSQIFNPRCIDHHGAVADEGLDLRSPQSHGNLVDVPSVQQAFDLVEPGQPDNSYLIHKLDGRGGISGGRMPTGGPFLTTDEINVIRTWIANGAPNN